MPSWIREIGGADWYDEWFTERETKQKPQQLDKKIAAGELRCLTDPDGTRWFPRGEVEELRAAYLRRSELAKKRKPSAKTLEKRYAKQAEDLRKSARHGNQSLVWHAEKVMIAEIFAKAKKPSDE